MRSAEVTLTYDVLLRVFQVTAYLTLTVIFQVWTIILIQFQLDDTRVEECPE